jgi:transmembrane sensor
MSMNHEYDMEAIQHQASRWFARLRASDCSIVERRKFDAWRTAHVAHAEAYAQAEQLWSGLDELAEDPEILQWRREARHSAPAAPDRRGHLRWLAVASLAAVVLCGGFATWWFVGGSSASSYATAHGEQRSVVLADGSRIVLNTDTVLDVDLSRHIRRVRLRRGEAMFEVTHDADRPFVVQAGGNTISDIGTRFDVRDSGGQTAVAVLEGAVAVARDGNTAELTAGEQIVAGDGVWIRGRADPAMAVGWTQGRLVFRATPLDDAVAEANRYGPDRLVIADPSLAQLKISGEFRIGNTGALVRALQSVYPIRAEQDRGNGEVRLYRR